MQLSFWTTLILWAPLTFILWGVCGFLGSHVTRLRGQDREDQLDAFKTGLLFGPIGVAVLTFRTAYVPDIEVKCPHCGELQDVGGNLDWFECWQCEKQAKVPPSPA
jgi:hypothetical protein